MTPYKFLVYNSSKSVEYCDIEHVLAKNFTDSIVQQISDIRSLFKMKKKHSPDIVFFRLQNQDDYALLKQLCDEPSISYCPYVILVSNSELLASTQNTNIPGIADYFFLPINEKELLYRVPLVIDKFNQKTQLEKEKKESEILLHNILPRGIISSLKSLPKKRIFQNYPLASIMFTDFIGYTKRSEKEPPEEVIGDLHKIFSGFDCIVENYRIEKIKTIGDAYMCAGGLPIPYENHAIEMVLAALEFFSFLEKVNRKFKRKDDWQMRIGIHTGPVVAGIIGKRKFIYDVWGDTVNTASRVENAGQTGKVNVTRNTLELISKWVDYEPTGFIEVKDKGKMELFAISRIKPEYSRDEAGIWPNAKLKHEMIFQDYLL